MLYIETGTDKMFNININKYWQNNEIKNIDETHYKNINKWLNKNDSIVDHIKINFTNPNTEHYWNNVFYEQTYYVELTAHLFKTKYYLISVYDKVIRTYESCLDETPNISILSIYMSLNKELLSWLYLSTCQFIPYVSYTYFSNSIFYIYEKELYDMKNQILNNIHNHLKEFIDTPRFKDQKDNIYYGHNNYKHSNQFVYDTNSLIGNYTLDFPIWSKYKMHEMSIVLPNIKKYDSTCNIITACYDELYYIVNNEKFKITNNKKEIKKTNDYIVKQYGVSNAGIYLSLCEIYNTLYNEMVGGFQKITEEKLNIKSKYYENTFDDLNNIEEFLAYMFYKHPNIFQNMSIQLRR